MASRTGPVPAPGPGPARVLRPGRVRDRRRGVL